MRAVGFDPDNSRSACISVPVVLHHGATPGKSNAYAAPFGAAHAFSRVSARVRALRDYAPAMLRALVLSTLCCAKSATAHAIACGHGFLRMLTVRLRATAPAHTAKAEDSQSGKPY